MKHHLLAGAAALALLAGGTAVASAADLPPAPAYEVPMIAAAPAVYDWTGFYAGVHLGYGWGDFTGHGGHEVDGILGGGQVGANWQFDQFVLGFETDIAGTDIDGNSHQNKTGKKVEHTVNFFGTVRGRAGFAFDRFLVYGTGGFAYADIDKRIHGGKNQNDWRWGWTAGGGVEYAVTDNITMRLEYLYADLGEDNGGNNKNKKKNKNFKYDYDQSLVRAGVNYKF
jgi:outer membrane immunogenic protein